MASSITLPVITGITPNVGSSSGGAGARGATSSGLSGDSSGAEADGEAVTLESDVE